MMQVGCQQQHEKLNKAGDELPGLLIIMSSGELMSPILRRPLVCLALCWAGGIVLSAHWQIPWWEWAICTIFFLLAWWLLITLAVGKSAIALALATLCLAATIYAAQSAAPVAGDPQYLPDGAVMIEGYPCDTIVDTPQGWRTTFRLIARRTGDRWMPATDTIYLYGNHPAPIPGQTYHVMALVNPTVEPSHPFDFSWRAYLLEHGLHYRVHALELQSISKPAPYPIFLSWRAEISRRVIAVFPGAYGPLYGQILAAMVFGVHGSPLPDSLMEQFRRAGTIHMLVVSGSQITLFAGILLFPLWWLKDGRRRTTYPQFRMGLTVVSLLLLGGYILLADRGPSVDRALLVVLLFSLGLFLSFSPLALQRSFRADRLTLLAAAALIVLMSRPALLFSPSMQLTFAAVLGMCLITPTLLRLVGRRHAWWMLIPASSIGAQFLMAPVLAWHFGSMPVFGPLTNLIALPLAGFLLPLGLLTALCAIIAPVAVSPFGWVDGVVINCLIRISQTAARCPWAMPHCFVRSPWPIVLYLSVLALVIFLLSRWADRRTEAWSIPEGREPIMW